MSTGKIDENDMKISAFEVRARIAEGDSWVHTHRFYYLNASNRPEVITTTIDAEMVSGQMYIHSFVPTKPVEIKFWEAAKILEEATNPSRVMIYKGADIGDDPEEVVTLTMLLKHSNAAYLFFEVPARTDAEVRKDHAMARIKEDVLKYFVDDNHMDDDCLTSIAEQILEITQKVYKYEA